MSDPGMIYTVYGTNGPIVDITGNNIQFILQYRKQDQQTPQNNPIPDPDNPIYVPQGALLMAWEVAPLVNITAVLNGMWTTYQPQIQTSVTSFLSGLPLQTVLRTPNIPATGRVRAQATSGPGTQLLILDYWVQGLSFPIDWGGIDAHGIHISGSFLVTVDFELLLLIFAQEWPAMQVKAIPSLHNANVQITGGGTYLQEAFFKLFSSATNFLGLIENQINGTFIAAPDLSQFTTFLSQLEQAAVPLGLTQCQVFVDPNTKILRVIFVHPNDPAPFAFDPTTYQNFAHPTLGVTQFQAAPGQSFNVTGTFFPMTGEVAIAWYPSTSGVVVQSNVKWVQDGSGNNPTIVPVAGSTSEFSLPGLAQGATYDLWVSNCDGLQCTPYSNQVSIQALGLIDLVLSYESNAPTGIIAIPRPGGGAPAPPPPGPPQPATHLENKVVATVPANPGTFSISFYVPPDAVPGPATLCATTGGQQLACVQITIVSQVRPIIYAYNQSSGTVGGTAIEAGQTIVIHGEGFTKRDVITLCIDQPNYQTGGYAQTAVALDGTFTASVPWPLVGVGGVSDPGNHTIIAVESTRFGQYVLQASLSVTVEEPLG